MTKHPSSPLIISPHDDAANDPFNVDVGRRPILDLGTYRHEVYISAGCSWWLTWTLDDQRPALAILPENLSRGPVRPCIIRLDEAHLWDEIRGDPTYIVDRLARFSEVLPIGDNKRALMRFLLALRDVLGELTQMPPMPPPARRQVLGDAILRDPETGKIVKVAEMTQDV